MSEKTKILVVDDEPQIRRFLRASLSPSYFEYLEAETGASAVEMVATRNPDIMLLDLGLPDIDGLEVIARVREWSEIPIIILSARGQESDKVTALDSGANDYLTKPFGIDELLARIRVAVRVAEKIKGADADSVYICENLKVDFSNRVVSVDGEEIHLTPIEFKLLGMLVRNAGKVITHRQLLREGWGPAYEKQNHYLRVFMGTLRRKIEKDPARPRFLTTEPGVGYRFRE